MGFKFKQCLLGVGPALKTVIIDNSDNIQLGDMVIIRNGDAEVAPADGAVAGVVHSIVDKNGQSVFGSLAATGSATLSGGDTVVVASDNETVDQIAVIIDVSKMSIYSATTTGTIGTTANSQKPGGWLDLDDENSVEEVTHTRTIATGGTMKGWGTDPDDSTRLLVSIVESEIFDPSTGAALA